MCFTLKLNIECSLINIEKISCTGYFFGFQLFLLYLFYYLSANYYWHLVNFCADFLMVQLSKTDT